MHGGVTGKAREGLPMSIGIGFALVKQLVGVDIEFTLLARPHRLLSTMCRWGLSFPPHNPAHLAFSLALSLQHFYPTRHHHNCCFDDRLATCAEGSEMGILVRGKACPKCKDSDRHRITRSTWMRLIPGTKYYQCVHCRSKYLFIREAFSISWPFGKTD
jgi:hypothetical protein